MDIRKKGEVLSELDKLYSLVDDYRRSDKYKALLEYISTFKNLSPYNAFLVAQQRPGARLVLTPEEWRAQGRRIRAHARPLVILQPFGPVRFVYDVTDTVPAGSREATLFDETIDDVIERLSAPYRTYGREPKKELWMLIDNLPLFGIAIDEFITGGDYAARIEVIISNDSGIKVTLNIKGEPMLWPALLLVSIRRGAETGERFASLVHELGHLFCYHLDLGSKIKTNDLFRHAISHEAREFEAESVAWLVCKHFEVRTPSETYLVDFVDKNSVIPNGVSVERIFYAANLIMNMAKRQFRLKESWLYKYDEDFKKLFS